MKRVDPIRNREQIEAMKDYLRQKQQYAQRDYLIFMMGLGSALRINDILHLTINQVWDGRNVHRTVYTRERKTGKVKQFAVSRNLEAAIRDYVLTLDEQTPHDNYLFPSRMGSNRPLSRQQAYNILRNAADHAGVEGRISPHSMRKTWGYHAYKMKVPLPLIMEALNHSSIEETMIYLGITQDELNDVYMALNL
ncbi:MAG: tyrosine-type recombinase/integrase [Syntrophomonadaceae bacterium]|nr:tyrosine-type recombinase/integrase [Syntrophomonadaceae bacterium]